MNHLSQYIYAVILFFMTSCSFFTVNESVTSDRFMPGEYFTEEAEKLNKQNVRLKKTILKNDITETTIKDTVDWIIELKPFININIAKPAQINSYKIDSIIASDTLRLNYTARDSMVDIKEMGVVFKNDKLISFRAIKSARNLYYHSIDTIEYFTHGNYRISAMSKPRLGREVKFVLTGNTIE